METKYGDPVGKAILDYAKTNEPDDIIVSSELCDDDIIPLETLFRTYEEMPELEKFALSKSTGKVLDVGAGAGVHALQLIKEDCDVLAIDHSEGAVQHMKSLGIPAQNINFFDLQIADSETMGYDTILMLMNGIGLAGKLSNLDKTLLHAKSLLKKGGSILCDSSDVKYLYEDEDGSFWIDLNSEYHGNFRFQMKYKDEVGPWFDWLYVDYENLHNAAKRVGLKSACIYQGDDHFLAQLTLV
jgi:ubiquinone/menaquinone biosynthesis C-methylase UbiE